MKLYSEKTVITKFKLRSNSVVFYPSFELFYTLRGQTFESQKNLIDNRVKGFLSVSSSKKIRDLVENWVNAIKADQLRTKKSLDQYICFVTLTLPSKQMHSDFEIKRKALNKFLIYASRTWKVKNYIWKAEPQKNGNIHFHILFDRFIPWRSLRTVWNNVLNPLGYIDAFFKTHGNYDPNSTDVHGLKRDKKKQEILFIGAYLAKYISKGANRFENSDRPVMGRLWGCSDNLKKLECFTGFDDFETDIFYKTLCESKELEVNQGDFFRVFCGKWFEVAGKNKGLMKKIDSFYWNQFKKINDLIETE